MFDEQLHEYRITDTGTESPAKKSKSDDITEGCDTNQMFLNSLMNYASTLTSLRSNFIHDNDNIEVETDNDEQNNESETEMYTATTRDDDSYETIENLIEKSGEISNLTFSCKVPGCNFSVNKSLLCIKGHILAEHLSNLS